MPPPEPPPIVRRPRHERRHFRCASCGYGATVHEPPLRCPICGRREWLVVDRHGSLLPSTRPSVGL